MRGAPDSKARFSSTAHPRAVVSPDERLDIDASLSQAFGGRSLDLADIETVRLVLRGNSVIDWNRAHFPTLDDVDRFLALHLLDNDDPFDHERLRYLHGEAVNYLQEHLQIKFPEELKNPKDVRQVFVFASQTGGFRRRQIMACVILKIMHVINHIEAAELRFRLPLSEAEVMDLAERRIVAGASRMRRAGFPLVSFYGSRKTRASVVTKLLTKKENTAVTVFDKLRFRVVTRDLQHVLPAITWMTHNLFPFNYVIPGQSHNNLVRLADVLRAPPYAQLSDKLQAGPVGQDEGITEDDNPFSGGSYRMVNFIADFPVRVDHMVDASTGAVLGRTVFALVEFQVLDQATAELNEQGENAHHLYKERQRAIVERRLKKGRRWQRGRRDGDL